MQPRHRADCPGDEVVSGEFGGHEAVFGRFVLVLSRYCIVRSCLECFCLIGCFPEIQTVGETSVQSPTEIPRNEIRISVWLPRWRWETRAGWKVIAVDWIMQNRFSRLTKKHLQPKTLVLLLLGLAWSFRGRVVSTVLKSMDLQWFSCVAQCRCA